MKPARWQTKNRGKLNLPAFLLVTKEWITHSTKG